MDYRRTKQLYIVLILIIFFGLVGTGVWYVYIRHVPTCFDNLQNQGEKDIDCGGPCVSCELRTVQNIEQQWTTYLALGQNRYDLIAKVRNPNPNFGLSLFKYSFFLYDSSGSLIKEERGSDFILPNQSKYLIGMNVSVNQPIAKIELQVQEPQKSDWQKLESASLPKLYAQDKTFKSSSDKPGESEVDGTIRNESVFDFNTVQISVVLLDEAQKVIGVNRTVANSVLAGEKRYFSVNWFSPLLGAVKSIDVLSETNLFSDENFMKRYGSKEQFQQY